MPKCASCGKSAVGEVIFSDGYTLSSCRKCADHYGQDLWIFPEILALMVAEKLEGRVVA